MLCSPRVAGFSFYPGRLACACVPPSFSSPFTLLLGAPLPLAQRQMFSIPSYLHALGAVVGFYRRCTQMQRPKANYKSRRGAGSEQFISAGEPKCKGVRFSCGRARAWRRPPLQARRSLKPRPRCVGGWQRAGRRASIRCTAVSMPCANAWGNSPTRNLRSSALRRRDRAAVAGHGCDAKRHGRVRPHADLHSISARTPRSHSIPDSRSVSTTASRMRGCITAAGLELIREVFKKDGILPIPCGNVGVQMGGFYRKEINTVDDLKGLKFRIGGLGGTILTKLGVVAAADSDRRHLPVARTRHHRCRRVDRSLRRREARAAQGREVLLLSRLVGRQRAGHAARQSQSTGRRCRNPTRRRSKSRALSRTS